MKILLIVLGALMTVACASPNWTHSSKTEQEFYQDNSQCMAMAGTGQSNQIMPGNTSFSKGYNQSAAIGAAANRRTIYEQCMLGQGYTIAR
jgi:hypothetical protein